MSSILSEPHFHSEEAAFAFVEAWLWPTGPVCPFCGATSEHIGSLAGVRSKPSKKNPEGKVCIGLRKCYACRKQFTVRVGTVFESSHAPLRIWLQAIYLLCSSKKGISTRQLQRTLRVGMKTAWFLGMRIREAMKPSGMPTPMGGFGGYVEVDETYIGRKADMPADKRGSSTKNAVVALVERGGRVKSLYMPMLRKRDMHEVIKHFVARSAHLRTDELVLYPGIESSVKSHATVNHSKDEYRRGDASTNTVEGVFSIFKRGMIGVYQHCETQHLQRYLHEFDFRQNTRARLGFDDEMRTQEALKGVRGKRLTYETTRKQANLA